MRCGAWDRSRSPRSSTRISSSTRSTKRSPMFRQRRCLRTTPRRRASGRPPPTGVLRVRAWLIGHPAGLVLVDTGIGGPTSPTHEWVPSPGVLVAALAELGVAPGDIPTVVITHVHDDHIGGLLDATGTPAFPNARHVLQRGDLEWQRALGRE